MMRQYAVLGFCLLFPALSWAQDNSVSLSVSDRIESQAAQHRLPVTHSNGSFSGDGWTALVEAGREAQFVLIGEEHGIAENPAMTAALFEALAPAGFSKLVIEVSPFMAETMDKALREGGMDGLSALFAKPGGEPAFFGMREEADMLARVRALIDEDEPAFWGVDYEVLGDRQMLAALEAMEKPEAAARALAELRAASKASWTQYEETGSPQFVFSFSGDPDLVRAVEAVWPERSDAAASILDQIEETLEINQLFVTGDNFASNIQRAEGIRSDFLKHWRAADRSDGAPRVMAKMGATHLVRGRNSNGVFDLGTTLHELAALEGRPSLSVMVLPGRGSSVAVFDPTNMSFKEGPAKDGYGEGLEPFYDASFETGHTLFDLKPLRKSLARTSDPDLSELIRTVHGFDYLLILTGSTPSSDRP